jgi:histidinol-phosphate aminotransferase
MPGFFRSDLSNKEPSVINVPLLDRMMSLNESCLDPYQAIREPFLRRMEEVRLNRYLSPLTRELNQKLAAYAGFGIAPAQVVWGNGADDLLYHIFLAVREDPEAFAVSLAPSYFDYRTFCEMVGLKIRFLDLNEDFSFDADAYLRLASDPNCRLAILCNPNNPTGNLFPADQLRTIVDSLHDKLVLIDETYYEFSGATFAGELGRHPNLILIRSFSKAFSGAGLRFGYAISSAANIHSLKKVLTTFHTSILNQAFALTILENAGIFRDQVRGIIDLRYQTYARLHSIKGLTVHPSKTNFLTFTIGERTPELFQYLQDKNISVRNVGAHHRLQGCLRVTLSCAEDTEAFLTAVSEYLKGPRTVS